MAPNEFVTGLCVGFTVTWMVLILVYGVIRTWPKPKANVLPEPDPMLLEPEVQAMLKEVVRTGQPMIATRVSRDGNMTTIQRIGIRPKSN